MFDAAEAIREDRFIQEEIQKSLAAGKTMTSELYDYLFKNYCMREETVSACFGGSCPFCFYGTCHFQKILKWLLTKYKMNLA